VRIKKAIIPAAGFGTRFLPATKSQPKEMLPIIDKPLIQYGVEEAVSAGIESIAIITSRGKSSLEDYFDRNPELERFLEEKGKTELLKEIECISSLAEMCYIRQQKPLGLGHAILLGESFVNNEPFSVLLPDDIFDCDPPCIKQLMDAFFELESPVIALGRVDEEGTKKYGIIKPKKIKEKIFQIEDVIEKPGPEEALSDLGIFGRYIFTPEIFDAIKRTAPDHRGEVQITDAIRLLIKNRPVYGYVFEGKRYDAGDKLGFIEATIELALKREQFKEKLEEILKKLIQH